MDKIVDYVVDPNAINKHPIFAGPLPRRLPMEILTAIAEAVESGKYLICITHKTGDALCHRQITEDFLYADIFPSLGEHIVLAHRENEKEVKSGKDSIL